MDCSIKKNEKDEGEIQKSFIQEVRTSSNPNLIAIIINKVNEAAPMPLAPVLQVG